MRVMRDRVRKVWMAALLTVALTAAVGCTSDEDGAGSAFRNLGKRGDSNVTARQAGAALK